MRQLFRELKHRKVFRVAGVYAATAFVLWQAADFVLPALGFPDWSVDLVVVLTLLGFPVALVLAWAYELTLEGVKRTPHAEEPEGGWGPTGPLPPWARFALTALAGLGVVATAGAAGWYLLGAGGGETEPVVGQRSIAVLPFNVSGPGSAEWREGMVTLLSTGLDGAAGLRAIDSRTVLARWDQFVSEGKRADQGLNLSVGEAAGATYALLGSAVSVGERVRFVADVVETATGRKLGQGQVEGPLDSVLSLADRLSVEALRVVLEEEAGELPAVDVASVTTSSVPALQSFLEGEAAHRRANFEAAIEAYRAAVERDSTFALAHYRIARALGWHGIADDSQTRGRHLAAAERFLGRLPARAATLLRADVALRRNAPDALDSLEAAAEHYPDDAEAWYLLGEAYRHNHLGSPAEAEEVFGRAVALDPGFAPYRIHHVELAFHHLLDSAEAARRSAEYRRLVGSSDSFYPRAFALGLSLVFGDPEARSEALAGLHSIDAERRRILQSQTFQSLLWHPMVQDVRESVRLAILAAGDQGGGLRWISKSDLVRGSLSTGQARKALEYVDRFGISTPRVPCDLAGGVSLGVLDPGPELTDPVSSLPPDAADPCLVLLGAALGEAEMFERWASKMEALAREARAGGDSAGARRQESFVAAWKGFSLLARDRPEEARELLVAAFEQGAAFPPSWLGEAHLRLGEMERAAELFGREWGAFGHLPMFRRKRARAYEALGAREKAAADYRYFADVWERYADAELQPMAEEAREAIRRLDAGGEPQRR